MGADDAIPNANRRVDELESERERAANRQREKTTYSFLRGDEEMLNRVFAEQNATRMAI